MTSFKVGCEIPGQSNLSYNALRFETEPEATTYGEDLFMRWTGMNGYKVEPSDDPVNYRIFEGKLERLPDDSQVRPA